MLPDTFLGHYRIIGPIGRGGMGEVYAAEDTKLHRRVAIKLLPKVVADDPDSRARFEREAQAVAALNHPNIVTIYSVEEAGGVPFLTMELVEGRTLREIIPPGGLSAEAVLPLGIGISDAIAAAHQRGMTHRDLKPGNVMVASDGRVKILDFGIAKVHEEEQQASGEQPTRLSAGELTGQGRIIGTVGYMSPEQAQGKPVDTRSDIFSIGVILHEMASGERPFKGDTDISVISSILKDQPTSVTDLKPGLPSDLARIIRRCLAKEPDRRYQTAIDLRNDLEDLREDVQSASATRSSTGAAAAPAARTFPLLPVALASLLVVAVLAGLFVWMQRRQPSREQGAVFAAERFTRLTESGAASMGALSADGRYVVHVKTERGFSGLWVRQTAANSDVQIVAPALVRYDGLRFSPDGNFVLYVTYPPSRGIGTLYKVPVLGGPAARVLEDIDSPPSFSPDGSSMAFMRGDVVRGITHLMIARADGSEARSLAAGAADVRFENEGPAWAPDGNTILVIGRLGPTSVTILGIEAATGRVQQIGKPLLAARSVEWMPDGRSFLMDGIESLALTSPQLWQVTYPSGERRRITNDLNGYGGVSLSADGHLIATVQSITQGSLWVLAPGSQEPREIPTGATRVVGQAGVAWTPDGHLVFTSQAGGPPQIWISDADGSNARQLTSVDGAANQPIVSPDGRWIFYQAATAEGVHVWRMGIDGSDAKRLTSGKVEARPVASPDGRWVYYTSGGTGQNLPMKMDPEGGHITPLGQVAYTVADVTPDGTRLLVIAWHDAKRRSECALVPAAGGTLEFLGEFTAPSAGSCRMTPAGEISYVALRDGSINVFARPLAGGTERQLTHFTGAAMQIFAGAWSRDGHVVLSRGATTSDIVLIEDSKQQADKR